LSGPPRPPSRRKRAASSDAGFSFLDGVGGGHHELSHHEGKAEKIEQDTQIIRWHVEQFAGLMARLAVISAGKGSLLDATMLFCGSGMSDVNARDPDNLSILLAGNGWWLATESSGASTGPPGDLDGTGWPGLVLPPPKG